MWCRCLILTVAIGCTAAAACDLQYDSVSYRRYYRANGWMLPGVGEFSSYGAVHSSLLISIGIVPGAVVEELRQDDDYVVDFPAQEFTLDGAQKRMRRALYDAGIARWKVNGHVVAYSYVMEPVNAHKVKGKWKVDSHAACIFTATFIDAEGDGVFRLLVPGPLKADLIPQWRVIDNLPINPGI
jgi:hypothetical protein